MWTLEQDRDACYDVFVIIDEIYGDVGYCRYVRLIMDGEAITPRVGVFCRGSSYDVDSERIV